MRNDRTARTLLLVAMLSWSVGTAHAQDPASAWNPRSGDPWIDTWLGDMNRYAARYREPFIDELVRYHGAPRELVTELLVERGWAAGDVYYACTIAQVVGRPCRHVVDAWSEGHAGGWGEVAARLGIRPGSAEFHRLKNGFVPTYERWARPIELDADLRRAYPDHPTPSIRRTPGASTAPADTAAADASAPKATRERPVDKPARGDAKP